MRTIYIKGVPQVKSVKEIVDYKEKRLKELEAQRDKTKQTEEIRKYNLQKKAEKEQQINECREYNLSVKEKRMGNLITAINKIGTVR